MAVELVQPSATEPPRQGDAARASCGAVVLGSDYRALALVRSLGRRKIPILVLRGGDDVLAAKSRYATYSVDLQATGDDERCSVLRRLASELGVEGWVLFASSDDSVEFVARRHEELSETFLPASPPWSVLRWASDKQLTHQLAAQVGLSHPRTWHAKGAEQAAALRLEYPVIIKPATKPGFNALTAAKAWRVDTPEELRVRFAEAAELMDPRHLLIQEVIPGNGETQLSYAALCERGLPLAAVTARRTRQYPMDFGRASTFVETIHDSEVAGAAQRFLRKLEFTGLVEVEFKRDPRNGELKLLDVNPRVWGWHSLCQRAGVDFPYFAWRLARGEAVPASRAEPGIRWRRMTTDLPTSLREIMRGNLSVRTYLHSLRGPRESAIFARDDPWPGVVEVPMLFRTLLRRLRHGGAV